MAQIALVHEVAFAPLCVVAERSALTSLDGDPQPSRGFPIRSP